MTGQPSGPAITETADRLRRLYTPLVYDVMDSLGLDSQCLDLRIKPLTTGMCVAGPAFTVAGGPDPRDEEEYATEAKATLMALFESMYEGCVVIVRAAGEAHAGHWGELMSTAARARGARGAVIDGGVRDSSFLLDMPDWPVFARYTSPIESRRRYRVQEMELPIAVSGTLTSQVRVDPGDWIFGDVDGVLAIPADRVEEVLAKAEAEKQVEDRVRDEIVQGTSVPEVYAKYGRL